jgi:hypothetical protein
MASEQIVSRVRSEYEAVWHEDVLAALDRYGTEPYHREIERVQHAILELARGDVEELETLVRAAVVDYRDVLYWRTLESPPDG